MIRTILMATPDIPYMCLRWPRRVAWLIMSKVIERSSKIRAEDTHFDNDCISFFLFRRAVYSPRADFTNGLKSRFRLKFKTLVLIFFQQNVKSMVLD